MQSYSRIGRAELAARVAAVERYQVLAFSDPATRPAFPTEAYHVIPADEVATRARYELDPALVTFVDCGTLPSAGLCQNVVIGLVKTFRRVVAVDLPRRRSPGR